MALIVVFLLGIGNFAMNRAVMDSGHPLLGEVPWFYHALGRRFALVVEFLLLLASLLFVAEGTPWVAGAYAAYSLLNAIAAWLVLTGRV
ncbi:hypothetical protein RXV95_15750 [Novosphingobium sp. ZN18A2]|uniref:hypothetical protein n=1 Tax=Novosphingobium sp. ZN18A2 TaxID=3079861 RepID=UPI0030D589A0